jgi:hypothetical protein
MEDVWNQSIDNWEDEWNQVMNDLEDEFDNLDDANFEWPTADSWTEADWENIRF